MQAELREAVEVDLTDTDKAAAAEAKKAMDADAEKYKSENADKKATVSEYVAVAETAEETVAEPQKKKSWLV